MIFIGTKPFVPEKRAHPWKETPSSQRCSEVSAYWTPPSGNDPTQMCPRVSCLATESLHTHLARTLRGEEAGKGAPSAQGLMKDNLYF